MAVVSTEQRFQGTVALVILHLRRLAKANDVEKGFAAARELLMIDDEQEQFMRECLALGQALQDGSAEDEDVMRVDDELIKRLRACVLSINSADPA